MRSETIPVRHDGRVVAVLSRDANLAMPRVPSPLEIAYLGSASDLCQMVADGTFPPRAAVVGADTSPRAGDGVIRLDALGLVAYASPNALSAYHRMGHAVGPRRALAGRRDPRAGRPTRSTPPRSPPASRARSTGRHSLRMEVAAQRRVHARAGAAAAAPGRRGGRAGARARRHRPAPPRPGPAVEGRHDPRDPPPREEQPADGGRPAAPAGPPHGDPGGPRARSQESVRRVNSIALVHESLSASVAERVDLDELVDKVLPAIGDGATADVARQGAPRRQLRHPLRRAGHAARAGAHRAGAQRARARVRPGHHRRGRGDRSALRRAALDVVVADDGNGLPPGFDIDASAGLGLSIVRTLLESELGSTLCVRPRPGGGTEAVITPLIAGALTSAA